VIPSVAGTRIPGVPENVWDYPRPPALVKCEQRVRVEADGRIVADSRAALRILETSHPPTIYVPPGDVDAEALRQRADGSTWCEWKGHATYFDVLDRPRAAWTYRDPVERYAALRDFVAFYPGRLECFLDDERVQAQDSDFYGGWITSDVTGY
jgi:uncharacterized protein (DUF427 family)